LFEKIFGEAGAITTPNLYETSTQLYNELDMATEMGWSLQEYTTKLDWAQRKMKLYHRILKNEKEHYQLDKIRREQDLERERQANAPQEVRRDRPGLRR
jgi:hypothetical protein